MEAMSTEPQVSTGEETQIPAPETDMPVAPEVVDVDEAEETKAEEPDESDKALKRMQRRIDKRTADVYRTKAENEQLRQRLAQLEAVGDSTPKDMDVETLAEYKMRVREFSKEAERIVNAGKKTHADYLKVVTEDLVQEVGPLVLQNGLPSAFMSVVLEASDDPKALLYHLGKNPELAEELADLNPIKLAKKLDRIERDLADKSKSKPGNAPKPLEAVKSSPRGDKDPSDMSMDEFTAWRLANGARRR